MKLISINIEYSLHDDLVLEFLKKENPDVVCVQELLETKFDFYKKELGFEGVYRLLDPERKHPKFIGKNQGVGIFAKKITGSGYSFINGKEENLSKPFSQINAKKSLQNNTALLWANVEDKNGDTFKIVTTHLPVTRKGKSTIFHLKVVTSLLAKLGTLGEFVLCGDMNAPRGRESFSRLAKKYKDNIPQKYKTSIDQNLHRVKGIQFMVDGLFTTPKYKASNVRLQDGVSDHMAIVAEITKHI